MIHTYLAFLLLHTYFLVTEEPVNVEVKLSPFKPSTTRGVITIELDETNEETLRWLRCEQAKILACTRLGRTNWAILTFDSPTLPKVVKYYMAILEVSPTRPKGSSVTIATMLATWPALAQHRQCANRVASPTQRMKAVAPRFIASPVRSMAT